MLRFVSRKCHFVYNQRSPRPVETTCGGDPPFIHPGEGFREKYPRPCGKTADRSYGEINSRQPQLHAAFRVLDSTTFVSSTNRIGCRLFESFRTAKSFSRRFFGFSIVARPRMGHTYFVVKVRMCEMMERQDLRFFVNNS